MQIEHLLADPDCRLLTLFGMGGTGKTRLALQAGARQAGNFADGVCFVTLAPVAGAELAAVAIAQSLGLHITSSDLEAQIGAYLRPREMLLILDNFEHLLEAAGLVARLLQNAPGLKVLVTSRERLNLREEWLFPIAGLSLVEGLAGEAGQLFVRSAQRVQPDFTGQGQEQAIADVCRQVDGMPLGLELAASWVRVMPCTEIARQIHENFDFLSTGLRNLPERHRSMRALFDQSWRLLSSMEQVVLMRLSVFQGGWLLEEAASVTGATLALVMSLVDKSLVAANGRNRFDLHELVRQYAAEQLIASGEAGVIRKRHCAAHLHLFRTGDSHLRGAEAATWFVRLEPEEDNLRTALQWALDGSHYEDAAWLIAAVGWFWNFRGNRYEQARWLAQLLPHRHTLAPDQRLGMLLIVCAVADSWEDFHPVDRWIGEIMQLLEVCSEKLLQAAAWYFTALHTADFSQASVAHERSIALARAAYEEPALGAEFCLMADRDFVIVNCLCDYGAALIARGKVAQAVPLVTESLELFRRRGNQYEIAEGLSTLATVALLEGNLVGAYNLIQEAVTIAAAFNHQDSLGNRQPLLGLVTLYCGNAPEARRLLGESLHICFEMKNKVLLARVCAYLAESALATGELEQAEQWLAQSLVYQADPHRTTMYEVMRLFVAARLAAAQQQYHRAALLFGLADQSHSQIHYVIAGPIYSLAGAARATVREALGAELFEDAFAKGQHLSLAEACSTILVVGPAESPAATMASGIARTIGTASSPQF